MLIESWENANMKMRVAVTWSNPDERRFGTVTEYVVGEKMVVEFDDEEDVEYHFSCHPSPSRPTTPLWHGQRRGENPPTLHQVQIELTGDFDVFTANMRLYEKQWATPVREMIAPHWERLAPNDSAMWGIDCMSHCGRLIVTLCNEIDAYIAKTRFTDSLSELRAAVIRECEVIYYG